MKIVFKSNYGNFDYSMEVELGLTPPLPPGVEVLIQQGLANIAYRVAGSAVDKALGVETGKGKEGRRGVKWGQRIPILGKDGKQLTETNDEGAVVGSTNDAKDVITETVNTKLAELAGKADSGVPKGITFSILGQHEYGAEGESAMVRATAFVDALMATPETEAKLRDMVGMLGLADADTATKEELVSFAHGKGLGISVKKGK